MKDYCKICEKSFWDNETKSNCPSGEESIKKCSDSLDFLLHPPRFMQKEFREEIELISPHIFSLFKFKSDIYNSTAKSLLEELGAYKQRIKEASTDVYRSKRKILEGFSQSVEKFEYQLDQLKTELETTDEDASVEAQLDDFNNQLDFFKDSVGEMGKEHYKKLLKEKDNLENSEEHIREIFTLGKEQKERSLKKANEKIKKINEFKKKLFQEKEIKKVESLFLSDDFKFIHKISLSSEEIQQFFESDYIHDQNDIKFDISFLPKSLGGEKLDRIDTLAETKSAIDVVQKLAEGIIGKIQEDREALDQITLTISPEIMRDLRSNGSINENDWEQMKAMINENNLEELITLLETINEEENLGFELVRNNNFGNQEDPLWAIRTYMKGYWDFNKAKKENSEQKS